MNISQTGIEISVSNIILILGSDQQRPSEKRKNKMAASKRFPKPHQTRLNANKIPDPIQKIDTMSFKRERSSEFNEIRRREFEIRLSAEGREKGGEVSLSLSLETRRAFPWPNVVSTRRTWRVSSRSESKRIFASIKLGRKFGSLWCAPSSGDRIASRVDFLAKLLLPSCSSR